jgi:hypothetical protein
MSSIFGMLLIVTMLQGQVNSQSCEGPGLTSACNLFKQPLSSGRCGIAADGAPCKIGRIQPYQKLNGDTR